MKIDLMEVTVGQVADGFIENYSDNSVVGFGGKLNIRPKYQREFVYDDVKRNAVVDTILKKFPLNVMYWVKNEDGTFEVLDGQQRTISFCQFVNGDFSIKDADGNNFKFENLDGDTQEEILKYPLFVYICEGTDSEKKAWFKTINIAGEKLTDQELLNAVYYGTWLTDAKRYFSRNNCAAYGLSQYENKYCLISGKVNRQEYLETALRWIANSDVEKYKNDVSMYMAIHQHDQNANELWLYFQNVINWVKATFVKYRPVMKGIEWGFLYNKYKDVSVDTKYFEKRISELLADEFVSNSKGVYEYVLSGENNVSLLHIRAFSDRERLTMYERQGGICPVCKKYGRSIVDEAHGSDNAHWELSEMQADHVLAWSKFGPTILDNCQMLCEKHNKEKSDG